MICRCNEQNKPVTSPRPLSMALQIRIFPSGKTTISFPMINTAKPTIFPYTTCRPPRPVKSENKFLFKKAKLHSARSIGSNGTVHKMELHGNQVFKHLHVVSVCDRLTEI